MQGRGGSTSLGAAERYEVVPDYAEIIRRARERLGWSHKVLAEKVRESERTIKRIEAGELVPTIDLARRLEKVLGVKLLEPVVEEDYAEAGSRSRRRFYLTLGDIAEIRED
jgi:putative transcription factor